MTDALAPGLLTIGNRRYSSWSLRPWLGLTVAGFPLAEPRLIPLDRPETEAAIRAVNPAGLVPVLEHEGLTVWDSLAILEYAAERLPTGALWPEDAAARARARSVAAEMHSGFRALRLHFPMNLARVNRPRAGAVPDDVTADIARIAAIWTECRAQVPAGAGPFLFGAFSAADAMYAPVATRFVSYGVAMPPAAHAWMEAVLSLPAYLAWHEAALQEPWVQAKYEVD